MVKISYTSIDFVASNQKAREFRDELVRNLVVCKKELTKMNFPITIGLKTTFISQDAFRSAEEVSENPFWEGIGELRREGIPCVIDLKRTGPTHSMYTTLFSPNDCDIVATADLDQFPPHLNLENILALAEGIKKDEAILGVGSRNVPVVLSSNPENSHLRRIYEAIMNRAVILNASKTKVIPPQNICDKPNDLLYNTFGDSITGVYMFNKSHPNAQRFSRDLIRCAKNNDYFGFEGEYNMAIQSTKHGNLVAHYFNSVPNPFSEIGVEEERIKILHGQIEAPLAKLASSGQSNLILRAIDSSRDELLRFYNPEQVDEVLNLMKTTLKRNA